MDAEQISLHQIQEQQVEEVIATQHNNGQQSYFVNKSIQQLKLLKCHNLASALFKTIFVIICLIPIFRYSYKDGNEALQILFICRLILEIFKLFEILVLYYIVAAQLENIQQFQNQAQVSYQVSDLDNISDLSWAIYKKQKAVLYGIIFMNWQIFLIYQFSALFLYFIIYTTIFLIYADFKNPSSEKLFQIIIMIVIASIDCLFFIIPIVFGAFVGCYQKIHQFTKQQFSINSKIIKKLKIQIYSEGQQLTEDNICIICWDTFKQLEKFAILPCNTGHVYHDQCITYWLKTNTTCPACRYQLN